jgi:uncharacterized protein
MPMKVLIDAVHAADVWTLGAVEDRLLSASEETLWLSRPRKDSVVQLIEARGRPHIRASRAGTSPLSLARELVVRDWRALRACRSFRPDVILTRSPAGVHAGCLTRTPVIYDTDDGHVAGLLFSVAGPLASMISSPTATERSYGKRHRKYRAYKELFYLHPSRFQPDPSIRGSMGVADDERLFLLRLTGFTASHDARHAGLSSEQVNVVIAKLQAAGRVIISSERDLPPALDRFRIRTPPERFHHVLAACDLVVGDSQTVCSEAAVVGVPSLRLNSWAGHHPYQVELEERWGLTKAFALDDEVLFLAEMDRLLANLDAAHEAHAAGRAAMLDWCDDPVDELIRWIYELAQRSPPAEALRERSHD